VSLPVEGITGLSRVPGGYLVARYSGEGGDHSLVYKEGYRLYQIRPGAYDEVECESLKKHFGESCPAVELLVLVKTQASRR